MSQVGAGWWIPPGFSDGVVPAGGPDPQWLRELAGHLRAAGAAWRARTPVADRVALFDRVARNWLGRCSPGDPLVQKIAGHTGLSATMVARCIEAEQSSSLGPDLQATLDAEFGNARSLDGFVWQPRLHRHLRVLPPELVFAVLPGNLPGLSHLPLMRALLLGSPVLAKAASGEPFYAAAYVRSLVEADPGLADCLAVLHWPGGDDLLETTAVGAADAAIVFGTAATIDAYAAKIPRTRPASFHGHRIGVILADAATVERQPALFGAMAVDVGMYDQQACLAPQRILVRGNLDAGIRFARRLADALEVFARDCPPGETGIAERSHRRSYLDEIEWSDPAQVQLLAAGHWGAVVLDRRPDWTPTCGQRTVAVTPVPDWDTALTGLAAWRPWLQNAGLAVPRSARADLAEALSRLGMSRIAPVGSMPFPSMRWHHDGRPCLADLVRFCDLEASAEAPLLRRWLPESSGA